jgi:hypothetical protein
VFIGVHWFSIDFTNFNGFQAKKSLKSTFGVQYIPLGLADFFWRILLLGAKFEESENLQHLHQKSAKLSRN